MEEKPSLDYLQVGLCNLTPGSTLVTDADEEVFFLYTELAGKSSAAQDSANSFRGLGHVDSHKDILTINFELKATPADLHPPAPPILSRLGGHHGKRHRPVKKKDKADEPSTIEIQLIQDKTALRSRKGDTGSVLWKASVEFSQLILQQNHDRTPHPLLDTTRLANAHVLELGAGTGLSAIVLSPLVRHYTVTDIEVLLPLIRKNLTHNLPSWDDSSSQARHHTNGPNKRNVTADSLDWILLHEASTPSRTLNFSYEPIDLLLIVDCIYHPSLLPALVHTINYLTTPGLTTVLVVVELRAEDVVREFLELWIGANEGGGWKIWHVNELLEGPYAVWIGWKVGNVA